MALPPEVLQRIGAHLDAPSAVRAGAVCRAWHAAMHAPALWRTFLVRAGYMPPGASCREAVSAQAACTSYAPAADRLAHISTYEGLFRECWCRDARWGRHTPRAPPDARVHLRPQLRYYRPRGADEHVWRIKADAAERTIITTGVHGGVRVIDSADGHILWEIPPADTRECPHLEYSDGWLVFDQPGPAAFDVWRSERHTGARAPRRGVYVHHGAISTPRPVMAYRLKCPTLACATLDGYVQLFDVAARRLRTEFRLSGGLNERGNVTYIDFDAQHVFITGRGCDAVSIYTHAGELVWTLFDHIDRHPPPACYAPDNGPPTARNVFQQRHLVRVASMPRWYAAHRSTLRTALGVYEWFAVHPDEATDTLVLFGQGGLVLLRHYSAFLAGAAAPDLVSYALPVLRPLSARARDGLPFGWQSFLLDYMTGQLSVADGRAVAVYGITTLLDLRTPAPLVRDYTRADARADADAAAGHAPFTAYEWADMFTLFDPVSEACDPLLRCSCVQMDAASVYAVARQVLDKEDDDAARDADYQAACIDNDSSMVMSMHFGDGALPAVRRDDRVVLDPPPPPPRAAEGSIADLLQDIINDTIAD